ncbi:hypothetical protein EZV73_02995 [Acidaminobacter sp. JC074]|uniref:RCC1 domain-containing protein n=1 Tax=Acidaminobacter sp. JC074 TaxID=2530199 RepID=UPI001F10E144|nr:S-layer homology domain-containing protein [Acidaminobacter sp. JC074]MCH4886515.1 hypothetical protein [Acidaminobacter sp. JC074]
MKKIFVWIMILCMLTSTLVFGEGETDSIISASYGSTYVIKNDGTLWGCGAQYVGNGKGYKDEQVEFVKILDDVRSVSAGGSSSFFAVKKDDTLWGWGDIYGYPVKGEGLSPTLLYPTKINIDNVKSVSASQYYSLVLKNDNTLWIMGKMHTGNGTLDNAMVEDGYVKVADDVIDMYAGNSTVYFIKDDNTLWGYGDNNYAELGNMESQKEDVLKPIKILDDVRSIQASTGVVFAVRLDNSLYAWGSSGFYTEEFGWVEDAGKPYKVMDNVKTATVDGDSAFIIKTDDSLWAWGYSYEGKSVTNEQVPYKVAEGVKSITLGERHAAVVMKDNTLWTMGGDYRGGLGYEANETWYTPLTKVFENVQDAPASWAVQYVEKAIGEQLIPNDMQNNYTKAITREEFCILAIRMIEVRSGMDIEDYLKEVGTEAAPSGTFEDCDTFEVRAAKSLKITKGTSETTFDPDRTLTRQEAATFLTNTALACGRSVEFSTPNYADVSSIADWAKPFTGYVYDIDVMRGVGNNNFGPLMPYQRQQAFITMYKIWLAIDSVNTDNVEVESAKTNDTNEIAKSTDKADANEVVKKTEDAHNESTESNTVEDEASSDQAIEDMISFKPYPNDYLLTLSGKMTDNGTTKALQYSIYHKDSKYRVDEYIGPSVSASYVFKDTPHTTLVKKYTGDKSEETYEGNMLPIKVLNPDLYETYKSMDGFEVKLETIDDMETIAIKVLIAGHENKFWYSTKHFMPVKYEVKKVGTDDVISMYVDLNFDDTYDLPNEYFTSEGLF